MSPTAPEPSEPTVTQEVLQFLAALYEERSISKAARRLRITVPKSSRLFHEARSVFREELFVRHGREMVPTNFMKNLKPKLETALTAIDDLFRDAVFIPKDCERVVRVSAIDYAMEEILTPAILEIRRVAPGVRFDVRPHDRRMLDFLAEGRLDLCIAPGTADETKTPAASALSEPARLRRAKEPSARAALSGKGERDARGHRGLRGHPHHFDL